jgi:toxin-antitoxin system PIN domain toxin
MTHLMDVSVLIAAAWTNHSDHQRAFNWIAGKSLATCPVTEMGFLRISTNPKVMYAAMADARKVLEKFIRENGVEFLPADISALKSNASRSESVTDNYLADLAAHHGCKLATFDKSISHSAAVLIT